MTIEITRPTRTAAQPRGLSTMLAALDEEGWRVEIAAAPKSARVNFALVARAPDEYAPRVMVLHGYLGAMEVQMKDVWGVVAHMNEIQADSAVVCLGLMTTVSKMAADAARQLGVEFRRLSE